MIAERRVCVRFQTVPKALRVLVLHVLVKFPGSESPMVGRQTLPWVLSQEKIPSPSETAQNWGSGDKWCCHHLWEVGLLPFVKMGLTSSQEALPSYQGTYKNNNNKMYIQSIVQNANICLYKME